MSLPAEQYEKISRFLDAGMDLAEMEDFEKELAASAEMRRQLDFEQSVRDTFALKKPAMLSDSPILSGKTTTETIPGNVVSIRKWLAISAVAAVLIAFVVITQFWPKSPNFTPVAKAKDTIQKKEQPPIAVVSKKDSAETADPTLLYKQYFKMDVLPEEYPMYLAEAFTDYEAGNYKTMQQLALTNLPQSRGADETENILQLGHYYKGLSFLQTNNAKEAILNFNLALGNKSNEKLLPKVLWYLALAYLKNGELEKAVQQLRNLIHARNGALTGSAKKLLEAIKK